MPFSQQPLNFPGRGATSIPGVMGPTGLQSRTGLPTMAQHAAQNPNPAASPQLPVVTPATPQGVQQASAGGDIPVKGTGMAAKLAALLGEKAAALVKEADPYSQGGGKVTPSPAQLGFTAAPKGGWKPQPHAFGAGYQNSWQQQQHSSGYAAQNRKLMAHAAANPGQGGLSYGDPASPRPNRAPTVQAGAAQPPPRPAVGADLAGWKRNVQRPDFEAQARRALASMGSAAAPAPRPFVGVPTPRQALARPAAVPAPAMPNGLDAFAPLPDLPSNVWEPDRMPAGPDAFARFTPADAQASGTAPLPGNVWAGGGRPAGDVTLPSNVWEPDRMPAGPDAFAKSGSAQPRQGQSWFQRAASGALGSLLGQGTADALLGNVAVGPAPARPAPGPAEKAQPMKAPTSSPAPSPASMLGKAAATVFHRGLTPEEQGEVDSDSSRMLPDLVWGPGTPLPRTMSSPGKGAVLEGLLGGGLGAALGATPGLLTHNDNAAALGALAAGGLGAALGGLHGYHHRHVWNEGATDLMRRLPEGATYRDYLADEGDSYAGDRAQNLRATRWLAKDLTDKEAADLVIPPGTGIGALLGALKAPKGDRWEGAGRGAVAGVGTVAGGVAGGLLGLLGGPAIPLTVPAGAVAGAVLGHRGANKVMGPPSWELAEARRKGDHDNDGVAHEHKKDEHAVTEAHPHAGPRRGVQGGEGAGGAGPAEGRGPAARPEAAGPSTDGREGRGVAPHGADAEKAAGLSPFARAFVSRCGELGLDGPQVKAAAVMAAAQFPEAAPELEKVAFGFGDVWRGVRAAGPRVAGLFRSAPAAATAAQAAAPAAGGLASRAGSVLKGVGMPAVGFLEGATQAHAAAGEHANWKGDLMGGMYGAAVRTPRVAGTAVGQRLARPLLGGDIGMTAGTVYDMARGNTELFGPGAVAGTRAGLAAGAASTALPLNTPAGSLVGKMQGPASLLPLGMGAAQGGKDLLATGTDFARDRFTRGAIEQAKVQLPQALDEGLRGYGFTGGLRQVADIAQKAEWFGRMGENVSHMMQPLAQAADWIFSTLGMNPGQMSMPEKLSYLFGAGGIVSGLLSGNNWLTGAGGAAVLGGLAARYLNGQGAAAPQEDAAVPQPDALAQENSAARGQFQAPPPPPGTAQGVDAAGMPASFAPGHPAVTRQSLYGGGAGLDPDSLAAGGMAAETPDTM